MKAAIYNGPGSIEFGDRPDPKIEKPTDALVRVVLGCVCGSDLWYYRGESQHQTGAIGHEFIGIVEEVGADVKTLAKGDFVIAPFTYGCGTCANCSTGWTANCVQGGPFGNNGIDGGQGEAVRVPFADPTLVKVPKENYSQAVLASLLTLSDVMCTGYHAAVSAGVKKGDTVAVVGDGAVGLCGVISAKLLGAKRIIALSRNPARQKLATEFGATDLVAERGDEAINKVMSLTNSVGADAVLECVGTKESMGTAFSIARVGAVVGAVGVPHGVQVPIETVIFKNIGLRGGIAPVRRYIPDLLGAVLEERINPGLVFDLQTDLKNVKEAYDAMNERRAIKSLLRVGSL